MNQLFVFKRFLDLCDLQPKDIKWVWLYRKNKFLQAISLRRASLTGVWGLNKEDGKENREIARSEVDISIPELQSCASRYLLQDLLWEWFFSENQIIPHQIYYEDFLEEGTWDATVAGIFDFLNIDYNLPLEVSTDCVKIATDKHHESYKTLIEKTIKKNNIPMNLKGLL